MKSSWSFKKLFTPPGLDFSSSNLSLAYVISSGVAPLKIYSNISYGPCGQLKLSGCTSTLYAKYCLDNLTTKYKAIMTFLRLWIQKVPVLVFKWFVLDCPTLGWFHFIAWFDEIWDHRVMEKCCSLPEEGIHVPSRRIFEKDLIIIVNFRWAVMLHHAKIRIFLLPRKTYFSESSIQFSKTGK